jgi:thiol:disulfide interchange protein DsbC
MLKRVFTFLSISVFAAVTSAADTDDLLTRLRTAYPATQFDSAARTDLAGIFEVRMGANVAYTDAVGKLWIFGHLYDVAQSKDLTAERTRGAPREGARESASTMPAEAASLSTLRPEDAIVRIKGSGARKLILFSDVDCPYCMKLEKELAGLTDVTIFIYPVTFVSDGYRAGSVWCSTDRAGNWDRAMRGEEVLRQLGDCQTPLSRNTRTAMDLGVRGTPTMMRPDGTRLAGYSSASRIEAWLGH